MINELFRTLNFTVGGERFGKTYFSEKFAAYYAKHRGPVIVYNAGEQGDFSDYLEAEIVDPEQIAYDRFPSRKQSQERRMFQRQNGITHFRINGKVFHFRDFNRMFVNQGKGAGKIKFYRIGDASYEDQFFNAIFSFVSGALLIVDDARPITRHGLKSNLIELLSRKNHAGKLARWKRPGRNFEGVDIIMIYHNLSKISSEAFDYANELLMFRCNQGNGKSIDNEVIANEAEKAAKYLSKAEPYTAIKIYVKGKKAGQSVLIPPTFINNL